MDGFSEVTVKISLEGKKVTEKFKTSKKIKCDCDDAFLKECVSKVLENFDKSPEKIQVSVSMAW